MPELLTLTYLPKLRRLAGTPREPLFFCLDQQNQFAIWQWSARGRGGLGRWTVQTGRSKQELLTIWLCTLAQFAICSAHNERPPLPAALVHRVAACVLDRNAPWPTTVLW